MPIVPFQIERISRAIASSTKLKKALNDEGITPLEFFKHLDQNPEDKLLFERSRQIALEMLLDDSMDAYDGPMDKTDLEIAKAKIAHRTWLAEKLIPTTYGTKITHDVNQTINIRHILEEANARVEAINTTARPVLSLADIEKDLIGDE